MQEFQAFLASTPVFAFFILCALYAIGEFIGTYTKAWIPSVFIIAILFLVGYWTFLPKDIVKMGGLGAPLGGLLQSCWPLLTWVRLLVLRSCQNNGRSLLFAWQVFSAWLYFA